ncbi:MAG TPA: efflux RND transporter periplasmic adaptor subunit [Candidatus Acidoferrales bacterium]|nr:efflux RND transporter periplasmic adaptor subunit [Candidatus Acidoferrales bacterium]
MRKLLPVLLLAAAAGIILWGVLRKREPPKVSFAHVTRQTLISTLATNGKVEPSQWQPVRAETGGIVNRVAVEDGQTVAKNAVLCWISDPSLQADIDAAEAKLAEARANLAAVTAGGKPAEYTDIENSLARARLELEQQRKNLASTERLVEKQAATRQEADAAREKIRQTELEIAGYERRRQSLVAQPEVEAARARLKDAESTLAHATERGALAQVRAPIAGTVYGREVRSGSYVNPGDLIANIGRLEELRVKVYVDEPELGRVAVGQPVTITWDALPGRQWQGRVEKKPVSIQSLGSRQVGEVVCLIDNRGGALLPGTNVNAEIRTAVAENALVIPKEALRHDSRGDYVLALSGDSVERRGVRQAVASITQVQIVEGLSGNDSVALPGDVPLKAGDRVAPQ